MSANKALFQALDLARNGDPDAALVILDELDAAGDLSAEHASLRYMLLRRVVRVDDALDMATHWAARAEAPLAKSTWSLRRALMLIELKRPREALPDLQSVLSLNVSDDQRAQAQEALLRVAGIDGKA